MPQWLIRISVHVIYFTSIHSLSLRDWDSLSLYRSICIYILCMHIIYTYIRDVPVLCSVNHLRYGYFATFIGTMFHASAGASRKSQLTCRRALPFGQGSMYNGHDQQQSDYTWILTNVISLIQFQPLRKQHSASTLGPLILLCPLHIYIHLYIYIYIHKYCMV